MQRSTRTQNRRIFGVCTTVQYRFECARVHCIDILGAGTNEPQELAVTATTVTKQALYVVYTNPYTMRQSICSFGMEQISTAFARAERPCNYVNDVRSKKPTVFMVIQSVCLAYEAYFQIDKCTSNNTSPHVWPTILGKEIARM